MNEGSRPVPIVSIKVLSHVAEHLAVWSVNMQPDFGVGRLCGAWFDPNPTNLRQVLNDQPTLILADSLVPEPIAVQSVDLAATHLTLTTEVDRLDELNRASRTPKGNRRAPLLRPPVPDIPTDFADTSQPFGVVADAPAMISAIRGARHLAQLADTWSKIETLRTGREYLRGDSPDARSFPAVVTQSSRT